MVGARAWMGAGMLMAVAMAGCLGGSETLDPAAGAVTGLAPVAPQVRLTGPGQEGERPVPGFEVHVPVDVVLLGFGSGVAGDLRGRLVPEPVEHLTLDYHRNVPPDPGSPTTVQPTTATPPIPVLPWAHYRVAEAPEAMAQEAWAFLAEQQVPEPEAGSPGTVYDANAFEDWLAGALPRHGIPVDANAPPFVLLHGGDALPEDHAWRYTYYSGWLEPVRVFGGRAPLLVMDASAVADPWVGGEQPYLDPVAREGEVTVDALEAAVRDAVHMRLLQGPVYPVSTKPCHAVTLVQAVRAGALTEHLPGFTRSEDMLDVAALEGAWENVTGADTVHVDVVQLLLPVDDPPLDALVRAKDVTLDTIRFWMDTNWDRYWVPHEGCEPYVSLLVVGDAADGPGSWGIAMYDVQRSHRISFSHLSGYLRAVEEYNGPLRDQLVGPRDPSRTGMQWLNMLYSHETGHLLGLMHPHNVIREEGGAASAAFSSTWSAMSYQTGDRTLDFGAIDRANLQRARAGYLVQAALEAGHAEAPELQDALLHLGMWHWKAAGDALLPLVEGAPAQGVA